MPSSSSSSDNASTPSPPGPSNQDAGHLKRSCDGCIASKVRCSGAMPCTRCESRKVDCFYRPRKKRTAPPPSASAGAASSASASSSKQALDTDAALLLLRQTTPQCLPQHERQSWLAFFTLYRNYRAGCSRLWFERQLARMSLRLQQQQQTSSESKELHRVFRRWIKTLDVDFPDEITHRFLGCMKALSDHASAATALACQGSVHFHVPGHVCPAMPPASSSTTQPVLSLADLERVFLASPTVVLPQARLRTFGTYPNDQVDVSVNQRFTDTFGVRQSDLRTASLGMGSGLLPWGGDLLCWIAPNEQEVMAFLQVCALNLTWASLSAFPCVRMVPSTHVLAVRLGTGQVVPCLIKCIHRETIDLERGVELEVVMTFEPVVPVAAAAAVVAREEDVYLPTADASSLSQQQQQQQQLQQQEEEVIDFPFFDLDALESDADFLRDLLDFAREV